MARRTSRSRKTAKVKGRLFLKLTKKVATTTPAANHSTWAKGKTVPADVDIIDVDPIHDEDDGSTYGESDFGSDEAESRRSSSVSTMSDDEAPRASKPWKRRAVKKASTPTKATAEEALANSDSESEPESIATTKPKRETKGNTKPWTKRRAKTKADPSKSEAPAPKEKDPDGDIKKDSYKYKEGINVCAPPLDTPETIVDDLVRNVMHYGFDKFVGHLNNRPMTVGTFCAGSESPVLGLKLVKLTLESNGLEFNFDHSVSAEIVAWKQAYIQNNFNPGVVLRDITEFSLPIADGEPQMATTAFGSKVVVPENLDLLVCGFCCVDFSALNSHKKSLQDLGESGDTFHATLAYMKVHHPKIVILENVISAPWNDAKNLVLERNKMTAKFKKDLKNDKKYKTWSDEARDEEINAKAAVYRTSLKNEQLGRGIDWHLEQIGYVSQHVIVDTKDYYLPQTRNRGYMVAILKEPLIKSRLGVDADDFVKEQLGKWASIFRSLERPASVPVEVMISASADKAGPGLFRIEEIDDEGKQDTPWVRCKANYAKYREFNKFGTGRKLTFWGENGYKKLPDFWRRMKGLTERVLDTLDTAHLRNIPRGFDDRYYARFLELSQNVYRATDLAHNGIIPCLTPTSFPFWTSGGRRLTGREALILQGIPVHLLDFSNMTEAHLQNLTGNAMSLPVVTAAITAALTVFGEILQSGDGTKRLKRPVVIPNFNEEGLICKDRDPTMPVQSLSVESAKTEAALTLSLCDCEKRHETLQKTFLQCTICRHTRCNDCRGNPKHHFSRINQGSISLRQLPANFEKLLLDSLPTKTRLGTDTFPNINEAFLQIGESESSKMDKGFLKDLATVYNDALKSDVFFERVNRGEIWEVFYSSAKAEMVLQITTNGIEWLLYGKSDPNTGYGDPLRTYLNNHPIARMRPNGKDITNGLWDLWLPEERDITAMVTVSGELVPSFQASRGLPAYTDTFVCSRTLIDIAQKDQQYVHTAISGDYELYQDCAQAFNTLHIQSKTKTADTPVYFFLEHLSHRGDPNDHCFVFTTNSRKLLPHDHRQVIARLPATWRQPIFQYVQNVGAGAETAEYRVLGSNLLVSKNQAKKSEKVQIRVDGRWKSFSLSLMRDQKPTIIHRYLPPVVASQSCESQDSLVVLVCEAMISEEIASKYRRYECIVVGPDNSSKVFSDLRWMIQPGSTNESHVHTPELWHAGNIDSNGHHCSRCAPERPPMLWTLKFSGKGAKKQGRQEPFEDPQKASEYERALKNRPSAITCFLYIGENNKTKFRVSINPDTLIHRAAFDLAPHGNTRGITVSWCMVTNDNLTPKEALPGFQIKDNKGITLTSDFRLPAKLQLRQEQCRCVAWQVQQETSSPTFVEEVIVEEQLPSIGFRLQGKASRPVTVRGGMLFHPVGFGKTAVMLALIQHQRKSDEAWGLEHTPGAINLKATLILVPSNLCNQWRDEITRFLGPKTNKQVLVIKTMANLKTFSVEQVQAAEIILMNFSIFENDGYLTNLAQFSGMVRPDLKASARAKAAFHKSAVTCVERNVDLLRDNPGAFENAVYGQLQENIQISQNNVKPIPSARVSGIAYQTKKAKATVKRSADDAFGEIEAAVEHIFTLSGPGPGQSYQKMKCLPLEAYTFARVFVDEFPHLEHLVLASTLTNLKRGMTWLASATPSIHNFEEVKKIAAYFGINLGTTDYSAMPGDIFRTVTRDMTDSEKFLIYESSRSSAWNQHRHRLAQEFLLRSSRWDLADVQDIPIRTHYVMIRPKAAHKMIYLENMQRFAANNLEIPRRRKTDSNEDIQHHLACAGVRSAEEALLALATFCNIDADPAITYFIQFIKSTSHELDRTYKVRRFNYHNVQKTMMALLREAVWLDNHHETQDSNHLRVFMEQARNNTFGEPEASYLIEAIIFEAEALYRQTNDRILHKPGNCTDIDKRNTCPVGMTSSGKKQPAKVARLRALVADLHTTAEELVRRKQAMGRAKNIRAAQKLCVASNTSATAMQCDSCKIGNLLPTNVTILGQCGHALCQVCTSNAVGGCSVAQCSAFNMPYQLWPAQSFAINEQNTTTSVAGKKLDDLADLLGSLPIGEKALLFIQDESMIKKVCAFLEKKNISTAYLDSSYNSSKVLSGFQYGEDNCKALILNIGSASAAGCNLTIANHVIFLAPYYTTGSNGLWKWKAAMEQAVGRAVRFGQTREVHVYHFLAINTIDVDLYEYRTGQVLHQGPTTDEGILRDRLPGERTGPFSSPISHLMFGGYEE